MDLGVKKGSDYFRKMDVNSPGWKGPLLDFNPDLLKHLAPLGLADLPTPVTHLAGLAGITGNPNLYMKRDDLSSPLYGGNKVRKLEFILSAALARGVRTLVTLGGTGSHHLLATAVHGRRLGMRTIGVVFSQPENERVRANREAMEKIGAALVVCPSRTMLPFTLAKTLAGIRLKSREPIMYVPGGGSSALGSLGYVNAGLELADQIRKGLLPEPEIVFVALGTGGTAGGLALGLQLAGLHTQVAGVRVVDTVVANRFWLKWLMGRTRRLFRRGISAPRRDRTVLPKVDIVEGYFGPGYGYPAPESEKAVTVFRDFAGTDLENTYTGKTAAAFLDAAKTTRAPLLFWNTFSSVMPGTLEGIAGQN